MNLAESFEHAGMKVEIHYDEGDHSHADPREHDGNMAILYCWHPHYTLGDEQFRDVEGRGSVDGRSVNGRWQPKPSNQHNSIEDAYRHVKVDEKATVILPLFLYDHSGITISAGPRIETLSRGAVDSRGRNPFDSAGWDTSWVGFAYTNEATRKKCGVTERRHDKLEEMIHEEVEWYDVYLRGEVFGYVVKDELGNVIDSCWGFLGDESVTEEAKHAAECAASEVQARELNRLPVAA